MPASDLCHNQIVHALEKNGWVVSPLPYFLPIIGNRRIFIDIYAERANDRHPERILIAEVKCFSDVRFELNEVYTAIGQYIVYRYFLTQEGILESLYLAILTRAYRKNFKLWAMPIMTENRIKMIVVDIDKEMVGSMARVMHKELPVTALIDITRREVEGYVAYSPIAKCYSILDDRQRTYAVVIIENDPAERPAYVMVMARIVDDFIVIDEDTTDKPLRDALMVNGGVPREQIILAYKGEKIPDSKEK